MNLRSLQMKNYKETFFYRWPGYEKEWPNGSLGSFRGTAQGAKRVIRGIASANRYAWVELLDSSQQVIFRLNDPKSGKWVAVKNMNREILVLINCRQIDMLIPKKRGAGYLKQPLGHHACPLSELAYQIGFDMYGLDGHLEVCTGYIDPDNQEYFIDRAVKPISDLLGYEYRLVNESEFFANHPVQVKTVSTV